MTDRKYYKQLRKIEYKKEQKSTKEGFERTHNSCFMHETHRATYYPNTTGDKDINT